MIVPPYCLRHACVSSRNASRPSSLRLVPSRASFFSTCVCVAMPAWSVPTIQRVRLPRMRARRMRLSWIEPFSACPMCSAPVTFGGGDRDRVRVLALASGPRFVRAGLKPAALDLGLDLARFVARAGAQIRCGHRPEECTGRGADTIRDAAGSGRAASRLAPRRHEPPEGTGRRAQLARPAETHGSQRTRPVHPPWATCRHVNPPTNAGGPTRRWVRPGVRTAAAGDGSGRRGGGWGASARKEEVVSGRRDGSRPAASHATLRGTPGAADERRHLGALAQREVDATSTGASDEHAQTETILRRLHDRTRAEHLDGLREQRLREDAGAAEPRWFRERVRVRA